jgi:hypothetical protein
MSNELFREGGPYKIKKIGRDQYSMNIQIPEDADGRIARECPENNCSPGYFKVKSGTGITENHKEAFCPYCRHSDEPNNFSTKEQLRYAKDIAMQEAHKSINNMIEDALGLGPSKKKKYDGGFLSFEISYKPDSLPHVRKPFEDILKRDIICPHCGLDHSVFGLATWCADCGNDIFITHVKAEFRVIELMLEDSERREKDLGARVAAKDIENAIEDTVSVFEAVLRIQIRRHLVNKGLPNDEIDSIFKRKIGNKFQNLEIASKLVKEFAEVDLFQEVDSTKYNFLNETFQKRHPITHNLGIVDKKFLEQVMSGGLEGRDIRVTEAEIKKAIELSINILSSLHQRLFNRERDV